MKTQPASSADHQVVSVNDPQLLAQLFPVFRVPPILRNIKEEMFNPQMVSIGPFHHPAWSSDGAKSPTSLQAYKEMEQYKFLAVNMMSQDLNFQELVEFLRKNKMEEILEFYEGRLQAYEHAVPKPTDIAQIIALDACFVIAFLHCFFKTELPHFLSKKSHSDHPIALQDLPHFIQKKSHLDVSKQIIELEARFLPIYSRRLPLPVRKAILQDLLLVENQIPLFALKRVINMDRRFQHVEKAADTLLECFMALIGHRVLPFNRSRKHVLESVKPFIAKGKHLLDCTYFIVCSHGDDTSDTSVEPYPEEVPGAKKLHMSGVKLDAHGGSLHEIRFDKGKWYQPKAKLSIPKIHVGDDTERIFRNLIAYESCYKVERVDVLSYLHFMDYLIDTPEDVELLIDQKIITEHLGSNEKVAEMWNGLCRNTVPVFSNNYKFASEGATEYCKSVWRQGWMEFYRLNLSKPWLVASLISAAVLLIMTFVIMWFTILLYQHDISKHLSD